MASLRNWLERSLLWRIWERMLEIEFVDRSIALAGKGFAAFFPLLIVVAAYLPTGARAAMVTSVTVTVGLRGDALVLAKEAFASAGDVRQATSFLGLLLAVLFAVSFTTALQRMYLRAWRRPPGIRVGRYWRGAVWLLAMTGCLVLLGAIHRASVGGPNVAVILIIALAVMTGLWWFTSWLLLLGEVRPRVLLIPAVITSIAITVYSASATIWMPEVVSGNEAQFGFFGIALSLVTWFSGAAMCVLVGACAGPVFAEDSGFIGRLVRGAQPTALKAGARPPLPGPERELSLRDAFQTSEYS
jgi:membrane protein